MRVPGPSSNFMELFAMHTGISAKCSGHCSDNLTVCRSAPNHRAPLASNPADFPERRGQHLVIRDPNLANFPARQERSFSVDRVDTFARVA